MRQGLKSLRRWTLGISISVQYLQLDIRHLGHQISSELGHRPAALGITVRMYIVQVGPSDQFRIRPPAGSTLGITVRMFKLGHRVGQGKQRRPHAKHSLCLRTRARHCVRGGGGERGASLQRKTPKRATTGWCNFCTSNCNYLANWKNFSVISLFFKYFLALLSARKDGQICLEASFFGVSCFAKVVTSISNKRQEQGVECLSVLVIKLWVNLGQ